MTEATLLALGSAVLHAAWNLMIKTSNERVLAAWGQFLVGGLLACLGGGAPVDTTCAGQSVKLCTADKPDCNCANKAVTPVAPPVGVRCEQIQCAASSSSTAMGERDEGTPMGAGMCGCQSVMGG